MVIIDNLFIHYKQPQQYLYAGEDYIDIYKYVDKTFQKTQSLEDMSILNLDAAGFSAAARELGEIDTGVILNSNSFIFNIFEFDKIPIWDDMRREIVQWRLKKVFPENIEEYEHSFFSLSKNKIFSILIKKNIKQQIETLFSANQRTLTYFGNSTVNILNHIGNRKDTPDFFVEIDRQFFMIAFQHQTQPYYIRKFRAQHEDEVVGEILRTANYVKNNYSREPHTYSIIASRSNLDFQAMQEELARSEIRPVEIKNSDKFVLPG